MEEIGLNLEDAFEYNTAVERYERLCLNDEGFKNIEKINKPHPTTKEGRHQGKPLYIESD